MWKSQIIRNLFQILIGTSSRNIFSVRLSYGKIKIIQGYPFKDMMKLLA